MLHQGRQRCSFPDELFMETEWRVYSSSEEHDEEQEEGWIEQRNANIAKTHHLVTERNKEMRN